MKKLSHTLLLLFIVGQIAAQSDLYIPREFQDAYKKGTRSLDGMPGERYWQNTVNYTMEVQVTPETRAVEGKSTVVYTNNSPEGLNSIVVRLYYDVFKKGNERGMVVNSEDIGDGVELRSIKVNGQNYDVDQEQLVRRVGTNLILRLFGPLNTGESITMEFEWAQKVPLTVRRTGALDSTSFFIAYWYPQVSVYDDVFGWDVIDYTFDTEFYNNLANFDVKITAPDDFLVWATGTFQNASEVLPEAILGRYNKARKSKSTVNVVTEDDLTDLQMKSNTWHYTAEEVTDFAFAMSDHYLWDAAMQKVEDREVFISTAFPVDRKEQFTEVTAIQQKTMKHFSEDIPGIPYPYDAFTTFIGLRGGGMEFPMMANNDGPGRGVTIHEMFHTYFPMYVRVNERRFAWMDEGWASFVTALVTYKYFNEEKDKGSLYAGYSSSLRGTLGTLNDLPTGTSSQNTSSSYGYQSYSLPAFTYALLYNHLGEDKFLECFRGYISRWAKKSPTPYDFFYTFEDISGQDLSWLWKPWYFEFGVPDLAIESFEKGKLTVKRVGKRPIPVSVVAQYGEETGKEYRVTLSSVVWKDSRNTVSVDIPSPKKVSSISLNPDMPDYNPLDNLYPSIQERYNSLSIPADASGNYSSSAYQLTISLMEEDGILKLKLSTSANEYPLIPISDSKFTTIDESMELTLRKDDRETVGLDLFIEYYQVTINATKD